MYKCDNWSDVKRDVFREQLGNFKKRKIFFLMQLTHNPKKHPEESQEEESVADVIVPLIAKYSM